MAKPILFWALTRAPYGGFQVLGVTSEKGRQVYGRDETDAVTHVADRNVLYRFPAGTEEKFAKAARQRADRASEKYADSVARASAAYDRARRDRDTAILEAAKGIFDGR